MPIRKIRRDSFGYPFIPIRRISFGIAKDCCLHLLTVIVVFVAVPLELSLFYLRDVHVLSVLLDPCLSAFLANFRRLQSVIASVLFTYRRLRFLLVIFCLECRLAPVPFYARALDLFRHLGVLALDTAALNVYMRMPCDRHIEVPVRRNLFSAYYTPWKICQPVQYPEAFRAERIERVS